MNKRLPLLFRLICFIVAGCGEGQNKGQEELFSAVFTQDLEKVRKLIAGGADVNSKGPYNSHDPPLLLAKGNEEIIKLLLKNGADPNLDRRILYDYCTKYKDPEPVKLLIKYGANINYVMTRNGNTPLHGAMYTYRKEIVKVLIENGADLSIKNKEGQTPIELFKSKTDDTRKSEMIELLDLMNIKI